MMKRVLPLLIAALILSGCGGEKASTKAADPKTAPPVLAGEEFSVGQSKVKITGLHAFTDFPGALENSLVVVVSWDVTNAGKTPISPKDFPNMSLVDGNGTTYRYDERLTNWAVGQEPLTTRKGSSDLNPNLVMSDRAAFEIYAKDFDTSTWHMTTGNGVKIVFCYPANLQDGKCPKINFSVDFKTGKPS